MFTIRIGDLNVQVNNHYELIREKCRDYIVPDMQQPDLIMEATAEDRKYARDWVWQHEGRLITDAEAELDRAPYGIYPELYRFNAFWLHACVIEMDGVGYAFSAPPGVGKSTHAQRWLQAFPDRAHIINGDNPIVRALDGKYYAYGTPFCGKEGYQENRAVPLGGVCFLRRAAMNRITAMDPLQAITRLYRDNWTILHAEESVARACLDIYSHFAETVPAYIMECNNMEPDAALVSHEAMCRRNERK